MSGLQVNVYLGADPPVEKRSDGGGEVRPQYSLDLGRVLDDLGKSGLMEVRHNGRIRAYILEATDKAMSWVDKQWPDPDRRWYQV